MDLVYALVVFRRIQTYLDCLVLVVYSEPTPKFVCLKRRRTDANATGLARLRVDAGYGSRRALSEKCGVSVQRLYDWETQFRNPTGMSLDTAHRLADALGVGGGRPRSRG